MKITIDGQDYESFEALPPELRQRFLGAGGASAPGTTVMTSKIVFNNREYKSFDELPIEARQALSKIAPILGDQNRDGVPDLFQAGHFVGPGGDPRQFLQETLRRSPLFRAVRMVALLVFLVILAFWLSKFLRGVF